MEFTAIVKAISGALWDNILLVLLCCTGVYFTLRLRFVQIVKFKDGISKRYLAVSALRVKRLAKRG